MKIIHMGILVAVGLAGVMALATDGSQRTPTKAPKATPVKAEPASFISINACRDEVRMSTLWVTEMTEWLQVVVISTPLSREWRRAQLTADAYMDITKESMASVTQCAKKHPEILGAQYVKDYKKLLSQMGDLTEQAAAQ